MSVNALARDAIVRALDELGEREHISEAWLESGDSTPYPPEAVHERSQRLQERLQWRRGGGLVLMLLVAITGGLGIAGWGIPGALSGFLFGFGSVVVVLSLFTDPWAEDQMRALQLYDLLKRIDGDAEAVSNPPSAEAA